MKKTLTSLLIAGTMALTSATASLAKTPEYRITHSGNTKVYVERINLTNEYTINLIKTLPKTIQDNISSGDYESAEDNIRRYTKRIEILNKSYSGVKNTYFHTNEIHEPEAFISECAKWNNEPQMCNDYTEISYKGSTYILGGPIKEIIPETFNIHPKTAEPEQSQIPSLKQSFDDSPFTQCLSNFTNEVLTTKRNPGKELVEAKAEHVAARDEFWKLESKINTQRNLLNKTYAGRENIEGKVGLRVLKNYGVDDDSIKRKEKKMKELKALLPEYKQRLTISKQELENTPTTLITKTFEEFNLNCEGVVGSEEEFAKYCIENNTPDICIDKGIFTIKGKIPTRTLKFNHTDTSSAEIQYFTEKWSRVEHPVTVNIINPTNLKQTQQKVTLSTEQLTQTNQAKTNSTKISKKSLLQQIKETIQSGENTEEIVINTEFDFCKNEIEGYKSQQTELEELLRLYGQASSQESKDSIQHNIDLYENALNNQTNKFTQGCSTITFNNETYEEFCSNNSCSEDLVQKVSGGYTFNNLPSYIKPKEQEQQFEFFAQTTKSRTEPITPTKERTTEMKKQINATGAIPRTEKTTKPEFQPTKEPKEEEKGLGEKATDKINSYLDSLF